MASWVFTTASARPRTLLVKHHALNPQKDCPCFNAEREYRGCKRLPFLVYHPHNLKCLCKLLAYGITTILCKNFQCFRRTRMRESTTLELISCHGIAFCFQVVLRNLHIEIRHEMTGIASSFESAKGLSLLQCGKGV